MTYYFTYGSDENFPYQGGWTKMIVPDGFTREQVCEVFKIFHPNREERPFLNCAFIYTAEEFIKTSMFSKNENLGYGCHEIIKLTFAATGK